MATFFNIKYGIFLVSLSVCFNGSDTQCSSANRFGPDCEFFCHCMSNGQCNRSTGNCTLGCAFNWVGPGCQRKNLVPIGKLETDMVTRHQSNIQPTSKRQTAKLAVDKDLSTCSYTNYANKSRDIPWWRIWLKDKHTIWRISIDTSKEYLVYFRNFEVTVENNTYHDRNKNNFSDQEICYTHDNKTPLQTSIEVTCNKPLYGNQLRIRLATNRTQLVLCDVRIYGECDDGTFGVSCTDKCSTHCNDICNKDVGTCTSCRSGWTGNQCNQACEDGKFGKDCKEDCSIYCINSPCNKTNGYCLYGCSPGYTGNRCNHVCSRGFYGKKCKERCSANCFENTYVHCDNVDGTCVLGCKAGRFGKHCSEECEDGMYGRNCALNCSRNCRNNTVCSKVNGTCTQGCSDGYIENVCNESCIDGKYGPDCSQNCNGHCANDSVCRFTDGLCSRGCEDGWAGNKCDERCIGGNYGPDCSQNCSGHCANDSLCRFTDGLCSRGCEDGWAGNKCDEKCQEETFGQECAFNCSRHCFNGSQCMHTNGKCINGCDPGWTGETCNEVCVIGTYGLDCSLTCSNHCSNITLCSPTDGHCLAGCRQGWTGVKCDEESNSKAEKQSGVNSITLGVASGITVISLIVITMGAILYWKRKSLTERFPSLKLWYQGQSKRGENEFRNRIFRNKDETSEANENDQADIPVSAQNTDPVYANTSFAEIHPNEYQGNSAIAECANSIYACSTTTKHDELKSNQDVEYSNVTSTRRTPHAVPISELNNFMTEKCQLAGYFQSEFEEISTEIRHPTSVARRQSNIHKNRFKKMYPYDHSRVKLHVLPGQPDSDYINASFINGQLKNKAYIASQGPVKDNVNEFWRMIWEIDVRTVVMVTNLAENGKMKCIKYWGINDVDMMYGQIRVKMKCENVYAEFTIRKFSLYHQEDALISREVTQFHFTAWPDQGVPETSCTLLHFWRKVRQNDEYKTHPWLVHCSAGIGRTGTFLAMDILFDQGEQMGFIDVYQCVKDSLQSAMICPKRRNIHEKNKGASIHTPNNRKPDNHDDSDGLRPILSTYVPGSTNFIKATYVPSYFGLREYIIAQLNPEYRMETCRLVFEKDIDLVITISADHKKPASVNDPFIVTCQSRVKKEDYTVKDYELQNQRRKHRFKEFVFESWLSKRSIPESPQVMLNLASEINVHRQQSPDTSVGIKTILFQSSNGIDRSGLVTVILNVLDRAQFDNEVSIPQVVRQLRRNRRELIRNFEQYQFCYDALNGYLESNATYANV